MREELQSPFLDSPIIELFTLDCSRLSTPPGPVFRFTPHFQEGGTVTFNGLVYNSIPVFSDGWEMTANGTQPRPTLSVSNITRTLMISVVTLGDLVGARLTRLRTLKKHLDGDTDPNPNSFLRPEIYEVEQKVQHTSEIIQWQMSNVLDKFGTAIPRRQITRSKFPGVGRQRGSF